ncbi:MAG: Gfo/Idh/MocA family oxidoreductase [Ruminococcaceae bacterium]|nr:Gfo/Idh/MocA family oxidoreductase [Oscillospiraceae bacterium]
MKQISVILIGAGSRGRTYCGKMNARPDQYKIVAIAEPKETIRRRCQKEYGLPDEMCFTDWREILAQPKLADLAVIATVDNDHYGPAMKAIELGYHLLLEKPVAQTVKECTDIANAAHEKGVSVLVCHVLRYTPFYKTVKSIVQSGMLGKIVDIDCTEGIGDVHFSHSYVRGNWYSEKDSTPMLLAKSCHDLDIIQWLMDKPCKKVTSFGKLTYFKPENAPEGAPIRCSDGTCPSADTCPYNCHRIYIENPDGFWGKSIFRNSVATHPNMTDDELREALKTSHYGMCVFHAGNDVLDNQIVNMEFEGGVTATLSVNAFNEGGRYIRIYGTKGELYAFASSPSIHVYTFEDKKSHEIPLRQTEESITGGHGGGDDGIIRDLYDYLCGTYTGVSVADIRVSVANHLIGFAAEEARHTDTVVDLDAYFKKNNYENL